MIFMTKKKIEVFLRKASPLSESYFKNEAVELADIIENQYIICLTRIFVLKVNIVKTSIPEIWHTWLGHLSYLAIQKLASNILNIIVNGLISIKIY